MLGKLKKIFHKIINSHALNSPIRSWAVAVFACAANAFMSTPYSWLTAIITSTPILLSEYADLRQIYLKNQKRIEGGVKSSRYFYIKHRALINPTAGLISFSSLAAYFFLTIFPSNSGATSSLASSSEYSNIIGFFISSLVTPSGIAVLIATITSPIHRMIHDHYIKIELKAIELEEIKKKDTKSMTEDETEQQDVSRMASSTASTSSTTQQFSIVELPTQQASAPQVTSSSTPPQEKLSSRELEIQKRETQVAARETTLKEQEDKLLQRETTLREREETLLSRELEVQKREKAAQEQKQKLMQRKLEPQIRGQKLSGLQGNSFFSGLEGNRKRANSLPSQKRVDICDERQAPAAPSCSTTASKS